MILSLIFTAVEICLSILSMLFFLEIVSAVFWPARKSEVPVDTNRDIKYTVLIPAHNEAGLIGETLDSLIIQDVPRQNIVVVADNCTDQTAAIAKKRAVQVVERCDAQNIGKGFALAFGLGFLRASPPDVVVIFDADCFIQRGSVPLLAECAHVRQRPVQCGYIMTIDEQAAIHHRIGALAFLFKNCIRPMGLGNLGLPCLLTGTGMAFPWRIAASMPFATDNIVEDMHIAILLLKRGIRPLYMRAVTVASSFPDSESASKTQRRRWEHGHLNTIVSEVPIMILRAILKLDLHLLILALDLLIPPLSLYVLVLCVYWFVVTIVTFVASGGSARMFLASLPLLIVVFGFFIGWYALGRHLISPKLLLKIPGFILRKIPMYLKFLTGREKKWIRTERD